MEKTEKNEPVCYCGTLMKDHKGMGDCNSPREMEEVTYERPYTPPRPSPTEECKRLEKENEDLLKRCIELESIRTARMERLEEACRVARLAMTPKYNPKECAALDAVIPGSVRSRPSTGHTEPEPRRCGICGGVVQHDGGKPDPECWPGGNRRNG